MDDSDKNDLIGPDGNANARLIELNNQLSPHRRQRMTETCYNKKSMFLQNITVSRRRSKCYSTNHHIQ